MKIYILLFVCLVQSVWAQYDEKNKQLDAFLRQGMSDWNVPGMAAVVVKDGKVVFQRSYGVCSISGQESVGAQTMFSMASTTKAITAMALGVLVDQRKLSWDDRVVQHIPEFKLSDPYVTQNTRVVDLLTHNIGVRNTDKIWVWDSTSTDEMMERYSFAKMEYPLRGGFSYQNVMYIIAAEVVTRVSGQHWHDFVQQYIFNPLDMRYSAANAKKVLELGNYVRGHIDDAELGLTELPADFAEQVGGAGGLWSCIEDMGKYLQCLTNEGVTASGKRLLKESTFEYLFKPQVIIPSSTNAMLKVIKPNWNTYGLGWFQHDYRGEKLDYHTGSLAGLNAIAGIMHNKKTAVYLFANVSNAAVRHAFLYKAMDMYAFNDLGGKDWRSTVLQLYSVDKAARKRKAESEEDNRNAKDLPRHSLDKYTGKYLHPMFGEVNVVFKNGTLHLDHNEYIFYTLSPWEGEIFRSSRNPHWLYRISVKFYTNKDGKVDKLYYDDPNINVEFIKQGE